MLQLIKSTRIPLFLSLLIVILSSCAALLSNSGRTALKEERIAIGDEITNTGKWQSKDISINYAINNQPNTFFISGSVQINSYILSSFPLGQYLNLYINFLDANGVALSTHDISPFMKYRSEVPQQLDFKNNLEKPAEAVYFNFSYMGLFKSGIGKNSTTDDWEIFYKPFEKN